MSLHPDAAEPYRRICSSSTISEQTQSDCERGRGYSSVEGDISNLDADHEVTPGSLEVWSDLPEEIRNDPSLAPFRDRYERQFGAPPHSAGDHTSIPDELHSDCERQVTKESLSNGRGNHLAIDHNHHHGSTGKLSGAGSASGTTLFEGAPFIPAITKGDQHKVSFLTNNMVVDGQPGLMSNNHKVPLHPSKLPHDPLGHDDMDAVTGQKKVKPWIKNTKIAILLVCWVVFTTILMLKNEKVEIIRQLSVPVNRTKSFLFLEPPIKKRISIGFSGPFLPEQYGNLSSKWLRAWVELVSVKVPVTVDNISTLDQEDVIYQKTLSDNWYIPLVSDDMVDFVPDIHRVHSFFLENITLGSTTMSTVLNSSQPDLLRLRISSDLGVITPVALSYDLNPIDIQRGVLMAAAVLAGLYVLIVFEIVHRTFAAMLASTMSVSILAVLDERPSTSEVISWIDVETLLLLFSMMVLVAILSETGIFDYLAVYAYKVTGGRVWPLINYLCLFTAVMSSFLDNVTTVLLMTPVTIRLCEVMELNPVPILMAMIIYSNVGGTLTPVGDPPNVIIASNSEIVKAGIDFTTFTMHMSFGIVLVAIQTYIHLRIYFRDINSLRHSEPKHVQDLRHEISIWQRAAASLSSYSKDEDLVRETLMKKVNKLLAQLKKKLKHGGAGGENYRANLQELTMKYPIRNRVLLVKSAVAVLFVIIVFFLHSIPELQRLSLGWTALLGALLLLILADREDMEAVLARVEWSTLLFFAALFILMEALSKLGLIDWIGKQTENVILSVSEESRLAVAILLILWVSAIASAFVDNIPLTTMMIRIATSLGNNPELNLPLQPLIWALAFGACLGGNGTLIGASANVVCAGVAEQHGYRFTFMEYFKVGFPVMLGSIVVATGYLLVCHCVLQWH